MIKLSINCRSFGRLAAGVSYLCLAVAGFAQSGTWTNLAGGSWAAATNWSGGVIATNSGSKADFSTLTLTSPLTVTLDGARTIGGLTFGDAGNAFGSTLSTGSGGPLTLTPASGLPLITVNNQTSTISAVLTGSAGLSKAGPGALVLSGANTFTGPLAITNGVVTFTGNGASTGAGSYCYVGGPTGRAVLNQNSGGTLNLGTGSSGYVLYVGGTGGSGDTGLGAVNQTAGTVNTCSSSVAGAYLTLGSASATAYGSYVLSGGTLNVAGANGIRLGFGGMGSYLQSGGNLTLGRYFSLAGNSANAKAVATFTGGGVFISSGYRILVPDAGGATGTFNIGTEAGGTALITNLTTTGLMVGNGSSGNGTFNLNSGTLQIAGPIYRNSNAGAGVAVNFNGGTLQAGASTVTLLAASVTNATVYNGGLVLDSQANTATFLGTLLGAAGNGVYPAGGTFAMASGGGSGYLGAPLVTVTNTGSGYGVKAIANIANGAVTGVTLTCPGQNYSAGDVLGFVFSGGGAITPATSYLYTLTAGDLSSNVLGGLTKNGSGILNLTVANTYTGNTTINAGTLNVTMDGGLGYGRVVVANGATLALSGGVTNGYIASSANLVVGASAAASLNFTGTNTVNGLSLDGGASFAAPGYYGSSSSVAPNQVSQFSGAGVIYVTAQPLASTVALVSSLNPAEVSQTVTLTATVSGSSGTPAGTVTFKDGAGILGTVALNGSGQATLVTSALAVGTHAVTAIYSGNSSYSSGSSSLAQVINPHLDIWSGAVNHTWDIATTSNWLDLGSQVAYRDGDQAQFDDTATGSTNISLGAAVSPAAVVFTNNSKSYNLGGAGVIGGAGGLSLLGTGSLTISNANAYAGATAVQGGTLNFSGASAYSGNGTLNVGNGNGTGVVNFASSGTFSFSGSASTSLGGVAGDSTDAGSGVINQSNGTVNLGSGFLELGAGDSGNSAAAYGCYNLAGGSLNTLNSSGVRIGASGYGVFRQTGGSFSNARYFAIGSTTGSGANSGVGEATFTGGAATMSSNCHILVGDIIGSTAVLNLGTEAGGTATLASLYNSAGDSLEMLDTTGTAMMNLNSGTLQLAGSIFQKASGSAYVNFNGSTLQALTNINLVDPNFSGAYVYNGGAILDSQSFTVTNSATMMAASGSGIYPAGGTLAVTGGGAGYIGEPLVTVNGGSGSGAAAIANISGGAVASLTLTCPGQNYQAGDTLSFSFSGGGAATPADTFNYTLQAGDVAANNGGLTKLGSGTLVMNGNNTYTGPTVVNAGTLMTGTAASGAGAYVVNTNAALYLVVPSAGSQLAMSSLTFDGPATNTLTLDLSATGGNISSSTAPANVSGVLTVSGATTINMLISGLAVGEYPLIQYGSLAGTGKFILGILPVGVQAHLVTNTASSPNSIDLVVTSAGNPRWDGQVSGVQNGKWDINTTLNWIDELTSQNEAYKEGLPVLFDDNAGGTTTVNLAANVHPGNVTFANSSLAYTLTGANKISGTTSLTLTGSGSVTVANSVLNDYTGVTTIGGGTLNVTNLANGGQASAIGAATADPASLVFTNGGTLSYSGPAAAINRGFTVGAGGGTINLNGSLALSGQISAAAGASFTKTGPAMLTYNGVVTNLLSAGGAANAYGIAAGTVALDGSSGAQANQVQGDLWVGFNGVTNGCLALTNTTLAISGQLALDPGNSGFQSQVSVYNSTLTCGSISLNSNSTVNTTGPVLNVSGTSFITNTGSILIGNATGCGILNVSGSATLWNGSTGSPSLNVGGTGGSSDTGAGAINQTGGTVIFGPGNDVYLQLGDGPLAYGSYNLSGGTLITTPTDGIRLGFGGNGSYTQSGGTLSCGRYFAIGGSSATGFGVATFTGGSAAIISSYRILIPDAGNATAVMNLGTETGGSAFITHLNGTGLAMELNSGANGTLNLNRGTLQLGGPIYRGSSSGGSATLNLNGGTLQAGANSVSLIDSSMGGANVYNGGVYFDTQTNAASVNAALWGTTGNGVYPAGGVLSITSGGGTGYLGAPLIQVSGGSGSGVTAIANVSGGVVTGVTLTCPGQNYLEGDTLDFAFAGGGSADSAGTFSYTLTAGDLAANGSGGLVKIGAGTLTLSAANTYLGITTVSNGVLSVTGGLLGGGTVVVLAGGTLGGNGVIAGPVTLSSNATLAAGTSSIGLLSISNNLVFAAGATNYARLNKSLGTNDSVYGLSQLTCAGTLVVTNIAGTLAVNDSFKLFDASVYTGAFTAIVPATPGAGLAWDLTQMTASGTLRVVAASVNTNPTNITASLGGGALTLAWPSDHTGWRLLVQTNNLSSGVSSYTNDWGTVAGSAVTNKMVITVDPAKPMGFYRLVYP